MLHRSKRYGADATHDKRQWTNREKYTRVLSGIIATMEMTKLFNRDDIAVGTAA
jgi:hypothetical protein